MSLILWNTPALATAIAKDQIAPDRKFQYLLVSNCMYVASGYVAWLFVSPPAGWLFWYEGLLVLVVTYFGLLRCRERSEGVSEDRLLENFVMLGVPLGLKLIAFTWLAHAFVSWSLRWIVGHLTLTSESSAFSAVAFLLNATQHFYAFLIAAIGVGIFYMRMATHLETIATNNPAPNPPLNTDAPHGDGAPVS